MIKDPGTMPESCQNDRGSGHDAEESLKRKGIWTQCRRVAEMKRNPNTMPESHKKEKGSKHDVREPLKR